MGQLFLVRHGQASFGSADYDQLSPLGVEQARILGEWFDHCGQNFDRVVTGDLKRHRQTADACMTAWSGSSGKAVERNVDAGFNEYDHDQIMLRHRPEFADPDAVKRFLAASENGKRAFQLEFEKAMTRWMSGQHDADYREPWQAFRERCVAALVRVMDGAGVSQKIVVFTSGGTISTLCQYVMGLSDQSVYQLNWSLVNSAVTKLLFQSNHGKPGQHADNHISLNYLNNYAHLERLGKGDSITYR
ncbi:MAG TPA: histidine phosphatase family protein [Burkholderiaceae bacterium]|jgi:broad specificity phosphatase PhoE|nr:histidine phosphatase family protein [Burkholderiaceae bacterium]